MKYAFGNAQGLGTREEQQDAFGFSDPGAAATVAHAGVAGVLADGMGGLSHGSEMARTGVRSFLEAYGRKAPAEPIADALARSVQEANRAVLGAARRLGCEGAAGATLVAAVLAERTLHWISAGDSRAYLVRGGRAHRLTVDHTVGDDRNRMTSSLALRLRDGRVEAEDETVTSFLGLPEPPRCDASRVPYPLEPGDRVLLASDGLYRTLGEREIAREMRGDLARGCESLVKQALRRKVEGQDNVTVMAMACVGEGRARAGASWSRLLLVLAAADLVLLGALLASRR